MYEELAVRVEFFGDEIEKLSTLHPLTGEVVTEDQEIYLFPASHYVAGSGADGAGDPRHRGSSWPTGWPSWSGSTSCWRRSGCGCGPATTSR